VYPQLNSGRWFRSHTIESARARFAEAIGGTNRLSVLFKRGADTSPEIHMLYTIAVILLVAWLLGFVGIYTIGPFVHVLLVVAIVLFLVGMVGGRRVLG
jgi:fatty acid desaturase